MVRRSLDGGTNWATVDVFEPGGFAMAYGVGADGNGNLYVVGQANVPYAAWAVRKSADGGNTWTTADVFQLCSACPARAVGFAADSAGNLFVAGWANTSSSPSGAQDWIVRENPGGNGVWSVVDSVPDTIPAKAICADASGHVFVGGVVVGGSVGSVWTVRRN
jgi:hypothetical protein